MEQRVFERLREIVHRESGISLNDEKRSLLSNRIAKRIRTLGLKSEKEYLNVIESNLDSQELREFINVISTNTTSFFREKAHFEFFRQQLAQVREERWPNLRIWCAASSSGEEPYTIAMCVNEEIDFGVTKVRIAASDICTKVLRHAMRGEYCAETVQAIPAEMRAKYLDKIGTDTYRVCSELRSMIEYREFNLSKFPYKLSGPLDFIFCRNVMIYFDLNLRRQIIAEFSRLLGKQRHLIIGHSENLLGVNHALESVQPGVYIKD